MSKKKDKKAEKADPAQDEKVLDDLEVDEADDVKGGARMGGRASRLTIKQQGTGVRASPLRNP